ncbi:gp436 family protein [Litorisediminicola beolgyonensis]|uniref:Gp436 family protein n=1 Tax=Litorisediminicola beolgyonensis TaxID=1173614 RepID=A0ABW3ZID1_9RHOB
MPYITLSELIDRYGERRIVDLTDRGDLSTGVIDADTVARAIADTDAVIDGYLAAKYALPLAETPPMIADLAQAICIYKLHSYEPDGKVQADYEQALKMLAQISSGTIRIPGASGIEPATTGGSGARVTDRERPMTEASLKGFV